MDFKVISNNLKDIVEEVLPRSNRQKFRAVRYSHNMRQVELSAALTDPSIDIILDVGANEGQFAESIRHLGCLKQMVSFEPIPEVFKKLEQRASGDKKWSALNYALGARQEVKHFNVYEDSKLSSFLQGDGTQATRFKDNFQSSKQISIDIRRLDAVWSADIAKYSPRGIFLKLDTQGYDLEVFKGLGERKNLVKYILTEMSVIPLYKDAPSYTSSLDLFAREGYGPVSFIPVTRNHTDNRVIEFDCLLRKIES